MRNTLAVVRSIARRSTETSSTVEEYAAHLDGRLNAFARTQAMLAGDPRQLIFEWREGGGPQVTPPQRKGFGTEMLERTLAFEFKGKTQLAYYPSGVHCSIAIPISTRVVHSPAVDS